MYFSLNIYARMCMKTVKPYITISRRKIIYMYTAIFKFRLGRIQLCDAFLFCGYII